MAKQFKKIVAKVQKVKKKPPVKVMSNNKRFGAVSNVSLPTGEYVATIGRRKAGSARVRVYLRPGDMIVNGKAMGQYFATVVNPEARFMAPFRVTNTMGKYAVSAKVTGSGSSAQLDAVALGIARALVVIDGSYRKLLRDAGLLTRDPRMKETRKPNTGGKARRTRQSPKR